MQPKSTLPRNYELYGSINLAKNQWLEIGLNMGAVVLFFIFGWFFIHLATMMRSDLKNVVQLGGFIEFFSFLGIFIAALVVQIMLHEVVHALLYWLFIGQRPKCYLKGLYAYAIAPGWYLPRNQYLTVTLVPFILITLVVLALLPIVSTATVPILLFILASNTAGDIGDLLVVSWLLIQPATILVQEKDDILTIYKCRTASHF